MNQRLPALVLACALLAGCSAVGDIRDESGTMSSSKKSSGGTGSSGGLLEDVNLWPFGSSGKERSRVPANATEYRCESGKSFYLRPLADGAMWLIAPDREIRLPRLPGAEAGRYGVARVVLEVRGDAADLTDPPALFAGCKKPGGKS